MSAETLTAVAVVIAALTGLVTAVGVFIVKTRVEKVHVMVPFQPPISVTRMFETALVFPLLLRLVSLNSTLTATGF